jgi:hypothetical protein
MECIEPQIIYGTVLTSRHSRQNRHNRHYLLPNCCQIYLSGLVVWDQPFPFLPGAAQNTLLWRGRAMALQTGDGRATEDLHLIEKGEMLSKKPLITDISAEYEGLPRASPNCSNGVANMLQSPSMRC